MSQIDQPASRRSHAKGASGVGIPVDAQEVRREKYLTPGSQACECTGCGEFFNSVAAFDRHQYGVGDDVRCMTVKEMRAKKMTHNERGLWVTKLKAAGVVEARQGRG